MASTSISIWSLPAELWIQVFTTLRELDKEHYLVKSFQGPSDVVKPKFRNASLLQVNLTCTSFRALVAPILYERMVFCGNTKESLHRARALAGLLQTRKESRGWVKDVLLDRWVPSISEQPEEVLNPAFEEVSQAFLLLENLTTLQINHTSLNFEMYGHLHHLPHLRHFLCWNISVTDTVREPPKPLTGLPDTSNLQITNLTVYNMHFGDGDIQTIDAIVRLALAPQLTFLHLSRSVLSRIFTLSSPHTFCQLQTLELFERLAEESVNPFFEFLSRCPELRTLRVSSSPLPIMPSSTPSFICPHLSSYQGSYSMAGLLVPGRPVRKIHCVVSMGVELSSSFLEPFKGGSVPLLELDLSRVSLIKESFPSIALAFPMLKVLSIWYINLELMVSKGSTNMCQRVSYI